MKLFITGGSGFVGREVVKQLLVHDLDVTAGVRTDNSGNQGEIKEQQGVRTTRGENNKGSASLIVVLVKPHLSCQELEGVKGG